MPHAFVSYVRENADQVDGLVADLYKRGVDTWTDRDILPGQRWKPAIRQAIQDGSSFIACFSPEAVSRGRSYMNEEITCAIETLREMPVDRAWFLPVMLAECEIPARQIGAGETLRDIQWIELYTDWEAGLAKIVSAIRQALIYEQPLSPDCKEPRLPPLRKEPSAETLDAWRTVWSALFSLQIAGEALFGRVDRHTIEEYSTCLDEAIRRVGKSAFFFDKDDFQQLNTLLQGALTFRDGKTNILDAVRDSGGGLDEKQIASEIEGNLATFEWFSQLLGEIRERYAVRTASSTLHLSTRRDQRNEEKIRSLEEAAARSEREGRIRRAVELMIRSGKVSLRTECPHGHGTLREWDGMPRCWTCGWPWKDPDPAET